MHIYHVRKEVKWPLNTLLQGWLFNICDDQQRCVSDPTLGLAVWFRQLWRVRLAWLETSPVVQHSNYHATHSHRHQLWPAARTGGMRN